MNLEQLLASLKKLTGTLGPKQIATLGAVFVSVVGVVVGSAYWLTAPTYTVLTADMDAESASAVVSKLKALKVSYELDDGGRTIKVPEDRADELRLQLAADGLPQSGRIGFEIFDRSSFGLTDLTEHVNYQRALEGELERTIGTLSGIASARVHISMAKSSLFADQSEPAKASVALRLKNNQPVSAATVRGIASLVASSVESLSPDNVVILDAYGRALSRPADADDAATPGLQLDRQQQIERDLQAKVVALLEPVVGAGRVRANIAVRLKADAEEETEERWDPTSVVRSKQSTLESDSKALPQGLAGARGNLPPAAPAGGAAANTPVATPAPVLAPPGATSILGGVSKSSETTNYEVSKLTTHRISPQGQVARISAAVIVDDERVSEESGAGQVRTVAKRRSTEDMQRIQTLVANAVGIDTSRGDQVTVENMAFDNGPDEAPAAPRPTGWRAAWERVRDYGADHGEALLRVAGILALGFFALFAVLRPMAHRLSLPAPLPTTQIAPARPVTVQQMEDGIAAAAAPADPTPPVRRVKSKSKEVARLATEQPDQVARIMRGWLAEEES